MDDKSCSPAFWLLQQSTAAASAVSDRLLDGLSDICNSSVSDDRVGHDGHVGSGGQMGAIVGRGRKRPVVVCDDDLDDAAAPPGPRRRLVDAVSSAAAAVGPASALSKTPNVPITSAKLLSCFAEDTVFAVLMRVYMDGNPAHEAAAQSMANVYFGTRSHTSKRDRLLRILAKVAEPNMVALYGLCAKADPASIPVRQYALVIPLSLGPVGLSAPHPACVHLLGVVYCVCH